MSSVWRFRYTIVTGLLKGFRALVAPSWYGRVVPGAQGRGVAPLGAAPREAAEVSRRTAAVQVEVVRRLGQVTRTKLVKLVYLIDERYFRLYGETLTGLSYRYDHYGPNACDNAIVKTGDSLQGFELTMEHEPMVDGSKFTYQPGPKPRFAPSLTDKEIGVVDDVLAEYGHLPRALVVTASKQTRPFRDGPKKGEPLRMFSMREDAERRLAQIQDQVAGMPPIPDFEPEAE